VLNGRVRKLEKTHSKPWSVVVVFPGESEKNALKRLNILFFESKDVIFIKIIGV
tara:strand:+ start:338 stop:499 length:162 start_codon:yes stop_codon:yes gene_type:complete